jgi:hypothetical protein
VLVARLTEAFFDIETTSAVKVLNPRNTAGVVLTHVTARVFNRPLACFGFFALITETLTSAFIASDNIRVNVRLPHLFDEYLQLLNG